MDDDRYEDIIHLPHHQSATRRHMSLSERAAQFSPFAALTGYEDCIRESARVTDRRVELSDEEKAALNQKLLRLRQALAQHPRQPVEGVTLICFLPDKTKDGGRYVKRAVAVKRVDDLEQALLLADGSSLPLENITALYGDFFGDGEDGAP